MGIWFQQPEFLGSHNKCPFCSALLVDQWLKGESIEQVLSQLTAAAHPSIKIREQLMVAMFGPWQQDSQHHFHSPNSIWVDLKEGKRWMAEAYQNLAWNSSLLDPACRYRLNFPLPLYGSQFHLFFVDYLLCPATCSLAPMLFSLWGLHMIAAHKRQLCSQSLGKIPCGACGLAG